MGFFSRRSRRNDTHRTHSLRFLVEQLEDRSVPAVLFTNDAVFDQSHVLIQFAPGVDAAAALPSGAEILDNISASDNLFIVSQPAGWSVEQMLESLQGNNSIVLGQPDYQISIDQTPNDPSFSSQWALSNTGQTGGVAGADIGATTAWDTTTGSGGVIVAVIDTGIDYNHPDLAANVWTNSGEIPGNGIDDDGDGIIDDVHGANFVNNTGDPMDDNGHGTHVAGTIGAVGNNGIGVTGISWNVQVMGLKFLDASGSGSTSNAIRALNYAVAHGASISNNSWGGGGYNQALYDAINSARSHGHIFVAAAGNSGSDDDASPFYPASYGLNNIVAVAATDANDQLASFSNYGNSSVDLAAPGVNILSTLPGENYGYKSGTSMATPHVTGALALVRDLHPNWSYQQVINQVLGNVDQLPSLSGKVASGGRLNLARAIGSPSVPAMSVNNVSLAEGSSGTTSFVFTVTLSSASSQTVTVNYATADGTATSASGDYQATNGQLVFAPGDTSKTITVLVNGDTTVEPNETFSVSLSGAANANVTTGQGIGTILNDDSQPTLSINNVTLPEGDSGTTSFIFTVALSVPSSGTVTVNYATANGTATVADGDYQATNGFFTFLPGETTKTITVLVNGDTSVESNETFVVNLSGAAGAAIANSGQGTGTIVNDDNPPITISIGNTTVIEGDSGTTNAVFTVSLSGPSTSTVTVDYSTLNGIAIASADYIAAANTLTFAPGETSKTISIAVLGDTEIEPNETFFVSLTGASNASVANGQGTGTIRNDDTSISIGSVSQSLGNGTTNFTFTVTLAQPSAKTVTVNYTTANGTLSSPNGYNAASGSLTFAPGTTTQTITVKVKKGNVGQYFYVNLSSPSNATITVAQARGTVASNSGAAMESTGKTTQAAHHVVKPKPKPKAPPVLRGRLVVTVK